MKIVLDAGIPIIEDAFRCVKCGESLPIERRKDDVFIRYFASEEGMVCRDCAPAYEFHIELPVVIVASAASTASDE